MVLSLFTVTASAASVGEYSFIEPAGMTAVRNVTFNVSKGKTANSLTLDGKTVVQGDGSTAWEAGFSSSEKNWVYDSAAGTLTLSQRYIISDTDIFGARELNFSLNYSDGTSDQLTLKGVYNYVSVPTNVTMYSESQPQGYNETEITPKSGWRATASSASEQPPAAYLDGGATAGHSLYIHDGTAFVAKYKNPHYVVVDMGEKTEISGVRYVPRTNALGSWSDVYYEGSDDGINFSQIARIKYGGGTEESVDSFKNNVKYRYYRAKIVSSTSGYATGMELHFIKPIASSENVSVDVSGSADAVWNIGTYGGSVTSVYVDGSKLESGNYSLGSGSFLIKSNYLKSLGVGDYKVKAVLSDSIIEATLTLINESEFLESAKAEAEAELKVFEDSESYISAIKAKATPKEVTEALDAAEKALGASVQELPYSKKVSLASPKLLYSSVSREGKSAGDAEVLSLDGSSVSAVGLGRAVVSAGGKMYVYKVTASKIALVLISGQSNAAGDESDKELTPSAVGKYENRFFVTNSCDCSRAVSDITKEDAVYAARNGGRPNIADNVWNNGSTLRSAAAASRLGARLSDEWDMPVWVVNAGLCSRKIQGFDPTLPEGTTYNKTVRYMEKVREIITSDSHYVLDESKTGMFWLQGESNGINRVQNYCTTTTMDEYLEMFMHMYSGFSEEIGINYCGIWLVRAGVEYSNQASDFEMSGPRLAQIYMSNSNSEAYKNIFLVLNTDLWRTGTEEYFKSRYSDAEAFEDYYGYALPTKLTDVKPGLHHSQKGYNELGDVAGEVAAKFLSGRSENVTDAYIAGYDGNAITELSIKNGESEYAVPMVKAPYYNNSFNLTVKIKNSSIASFNEKTFTVKGLSDGETEAELYCGDKLIKTYPVTVWGGAEEDEILSDRTKWIMTASSKWNDARDVRYLTDSNVNTSWTADITKTLPENEQWVEIELPESTVVSGFAFNSYDDANGFPTQYEIYVDSGNGEYIKAAEGTYAQSDFIEHEKYSIGFDKNYTAKKVKFLFKMGVSRLAAMSEVYLTGRNKALPDYEVAASIAISDAQSGVYSDNTADIRFITKINSLESGAQVEYYGSYAVKSSAFDKDNMSETLIKKATIADSAKVKVGDSWALDIKNITEDKFDEAVTAISFVKLKGDDKVYYSAPKLLSGIDESVELGERAGSRAVGIEESLVKIHGRYGVSSDGKIISSQPASGIEIAFEGTELSVDFSVYNNDYFTNQGAYIHAFVDDEIVLYYDYEDDNRTFASTGENRITVCSGLPYGKHTVKVLKANEGYYNAITWNNIYTDGKILDPPGEKAKKIQFVGDSITCCASGLYYPENSNGNAVNVKYEDSLHSYASYVGRALDADVELFARSGLSMYSLFNNGTETPHYEKIDPFAVVGSLNAMWDHTKFEPDLIVQFNWVNEYNQIQNNGKTAEEIRDIYVRMFKMFHTDHPNAKLMMVCNTHKTEFKAVLESAIEAYEKEGNDTSWIGILTYDTPAFVTTWGHPDPREQNDIAAQLVPQIVDFMGW